MPRKYIPKYFSSVRLAREALKDKAAEIFQAYWGLHLKAIEAGDFDTAERILAYLMDHMPAEEGERMLDRSVDAKAASDVKPTQIGPGIQIGIALGGMSKPGPKSLADKTIIDITPTTIDDKSDEQS